MTYAQLGKSLLSSLMKVVNSADFRGGSAKPKQCEIGMSCKGACISKRRECLNSLAGQAKTYAGWLQKQIAAGAEFPADEKFTAAIATARPINAGETFNHGGLLRIKVEGQEYFAKRSQSSALAQSELASHELAKSLGMGDDLLPVKLVSIKGQDHVVSPFVELGNFRDRTNPNIPVKAELLNHEQAMKMLTFDYLTGMRDRHTGNVALTGGKIKLIDNEFTFGSDSDKDGYVGTPFDFRGVKFNTFYEQHRQLNRAENQPDRPANIDVALARAAIANKDQALAILKSRGLLTEGYEKRLNLLKEVLDSDKPTFDELAERIGREDFS